VSFFPGILCVREITIARTFLIALMMILVSQWKCSYYYYPWNKQRIRPPTMIPWDNRPRHPSRAFVVRPLRPKPVNARGLPYRPKNWKFWLHFNVIQGLNQIQRVYIDSASASLQFPVLLTTNQK
jgi:hypothetical protein